MNRTMKTLIFSLLILALLIPGAMAGPKQTVTIEDTNGYSYAAPDGNLIFQVIVADLPIGTSQHHLFTSPNGTYTIDITTWDDWGWKNAKVEVTYPNGTTLSDTGSLLSPFGTYQTNIQPVMFQLQGQAIFKVDITVGVVPTTVAVGGRAKMNWGASNAMGYEEVTGSWDGETSKVYVYYTTNEDFRSTISTYNPLAILSDIAGGIFVWSWEMVIAFISSIPVIGPQMVIALDLAGIIVTEILYWLSFVVVNAPAIFLSVETMILFFSVISVGKLRGIKSFGKIAGNFKKYNIQMFNGASWLVRIGIEIVSQIVAVIASIVQSLKPI